MIFGILSSNLHRIGSFEIFHQDFKPFQGELPQRRLPYRKINIQASGGCSPDQIFDLRSLVKTMLNWFSHLWLSFAG